MFITKVCVRLNCKNNSNCFLADLFRSVPFRQVLPFFSRSTNLLALFELAALTQIRTHGDQSVLLAIKISSKIWRMLDYFSEIIRSSYSHIVIKKENFKQKVKQYILNTNATRSTDRIGP